MSETMDKALQSKKEAEAKTAHLGNVNTSTGFGAGAGGGFGLNAPGHGPPVKSFAGNASGAKSIDVDSKVVDSWMQVMDDEKPTTWIICEYDTGFKALSLMKTGEGGMKDFISNLPADAICWGGFRCYGVDKRGGVECKRAKFVCVQWMPESVSQIKKAKAGPHKGDVKLAITGCHIDLMAETKDDFEEQGLIKKFQAATGAHKPNGYMFEDGEFLEADYYGLGIGKECKGETSSVNAPGGRRTSKALLCADDENRDLNRAVANNAADTEQLRRVAEMEQADSLAKEERKENQAAALGALAAEQERRVSEIGTEKKKSISVPDAADLAAKLSAMGKAVDQD